MSADRHDLTDAHWALLEPLLRDRRPRRGGRWAVHRRVVDGVIWRVRTGSPWRDLPEAHGPWQTVYDRPRRWSGDGTWEQVLARLPAGYDVDLAAEQGEWVVSIDSTIVRAHHDAAGARGEPPQDVPVTALAMQVPPSPRDPGVRGVNTGHADPDAQRLQASRDREGLGRSRGRLSTEVHVLADARCRPLVCVLSPGQRGDTLSYGPLVDRLRIARKGPGRPRSRPDRLLGDKACSSRLLRADLRRRRIRATSAIPADQVAHRARRGSTGGRPPAFDPERYKDRNTVERTFNKLEDHRAFAMRTDKRAHIYAGTTTVAAIRIWLRDLTRRDPSDTPYSSGAGARSADQLASSTVKSLAVIVVAHGRHSYPDQVLTTVAARLPHVRP